MCCSNQSVVSAAWLLIQETPHLPAAARMLQLPQRLGLDLADAFAGDAELLADFLQRVIGVHADADAHAQDAFLAGGEGGEDPGDSRMEVGVVGGVPRGERVLVTIGRAACR